MKRSEMTLTQLRTTQLGGTGLEITRVGFGAWALGGGDWEHGWGRQDDTESVDAIHHALELVDRLTQVAERYDTTPGAIAVAWALRNPAVDSAIVGFRRPDQVDPILTAANLDLTNEDITEIEGSTR
jgi:aryl-alcohol dehydrogenase-like predicted oxidoreductase